MGAVDHEIVPSATHPLLRAAGVTKTYGGIAALSDVSIEVVAGEVHALMGANGAGKSTLIRVLCGVEHPDQGSIRWQGEAVSYRNLRDAMDAGIAVMFQQLNVVEDLTVGEYVTLGREKTRLGLLDKRAMLNAATAALDLTNIDLDPRRSAASLTVAERELLEIARAVSRDARLVIMDEPTASLGHAEVDRLFEVIDGLKRRGVAILYVSHHLDEVVAIADRSTVLRDGRNAGELPRASASKDALLEMMVGRSISARARPQRFEVGPPLLQLQGVCTATGVSDVNLTVHRGEVVGLYGLMGAGRTELLRALYGLDPVTSGSVRLGDREFIARSPYDAAANGIGFVPEDRIRHAIIGEATVAANLTLAAPTQVKRGRLYSLDKERRVAADAVDRIGIKVPSVSAGITELSGGNQQKVVIGRWLVRGTTLLLLDDPTVGVDVAAKQEIYRLIHEATASGMGVLVSSSEIEELTSLADRIVVMHRRRVVGVVESAGADGDAIVRLAIEGRQSVTTEHLEVPA